MHLRHSCALLMMTFKNVCLLLRRLSTLSITQPHLKFSSLHTLLSRVINLFNSQEMSISLSGQSPTNTYLSEDRDTVDIKNVTVKFQIDEVQFVANTYTNSLFMHEIKADIAEKFCIDPKYLSFRQQGESFPLNDETVLHDAHSNEFGVVEIKIELSEGATEQGIQLDPQLYYASFVLNDVITVHVPATMSRDGCAKNLLVEIENRTIVKPFIGGYVHKKTGLEYHDAFSQTGPSDDHISKIQEKLSRDTQTVEVAVTAADTNLDHAVQVYGDAKKFTYDPGSQEYEIIPEAYETFEETQRKIDMDRKVRLIQRNFRRYLWEQLIKKSAAEWRATAVEQEKRESDRKEHHVRKNESSCIKKAFPKTKQDFDLLYAQIESWKESEIARINEQFTGPPKIAELNALLDKEIKLLNGIQKQRFLLRRELENEKNAKLLDKLGKPVSWINSKNKRIEMDTLSAQRARYLTKYYVEMKKSLNAEERLTVLAHVIPVIYNEEHSKVPDLLEMIERERSMLIRGVDMDCLEGLRKRQNVLLMDIIKNEENEKREKPKMKLCGKCRTVRPIVEFAMQTRQTNTSVCQHCSNLNTPPVDQTVYLSILRSIRRDERRRGALSSYAFIIQETDIKYIVENIWHGHSILSQCAARSDLRLPRFYISQDWAPWNCVLLTENEARLHVKIEDLEYVYEENVLKDIKNKHELARGAFKQLRDVDDVFVESGDWWDAGMNEGEQ